jgi:uncharacterized membrane protein YkoI
MQQSFRTRSARGAHIARMKRALLICAALLTLIFQPVAQAADANQRFDPRSRYSADEARDARRSGDLLPVRDVINIVRRQYPGAQVLDTQLMRTSSPHYVVRILNRDGRRIDVRVDARTGRIMSAR